MGAVDPLVSVVIPSLGRDSLREAVGSVLAQTYSNLEIVVRLDRNRIIGSEDSLPHDPRLKVCIAAEHEDISVARSRAVEDSAGKFVAFLDDDDRFRKSKIQLQVDAAQNEIAKGARHVVVGGRVAVYDQGGRQIGVTPRRLPSTGEAVATYLFRRRKVRPGETALGASMMLCDRDLLNVVHYGRPSSLHEDWDWIISADQTAGTIIIVIPEVVAEYVIEPFGTSASTRSDWRVSAEWLAEHRGILDGSTSADFLLCYTLPIALAQRDWRGMFRLFVQSCQIGPPSPAAVVFVVLLVILPERLRRILGSRASWIRERFHSWGADLKLSYEHLFRE